jgi:hypothetical protein
MINTIVDNQKLTSVVSLDPGKDFLGREVELWVLMYKDNSWYQYFKDDPKNLQDCWRPIALNDKLTTFNGTVKELAKNFNYKIITDKQTMEPGPVTICFYLDLKVDNMISLENHGLNHLFYNVARVRIPREEKQ